MGLHILVICDDITDPVVRTDVVQFIKVQNIKNNLPAGLGVRVGSLLGTSLLSLVICEVSS